MLVLMCVLVSFGLQQTSALAAPERASYVNAGFADYYVGVLYRGGKYLDAAVLAKNLLDGDWITKEADCVAAMTRAYLVMQIAHRLGRVEPIAGLMGAQVQALRHWVRGADPVLPALAGSTVAETVVAISEAEPKTRVMGWTKENLGFADPLPLKETPVTEYAPQVPVAMLGVTTMAYAVHPTTTYQPPSERAVRPAYAEDEDADSPAPVKAKPRKSRPAVKTAATSSVQTAAPPKVTEQWVDRAFGQ